MGDHMAAAAYIRQKMQAEQAERGANQCGVMSQETGPARHSFRTRLTIQLHDAEIEARRAEGLRELDCLLDKNPEVSRILDLIDLVK